MNCIELKGGSIGPQNYIFGYGSLVEDESRERTTPSARDAYPVMVEGIRRGWFARGARSGLNTTYVGALDDPEARTNGVIYPVSEQELAATDQSESAAYRRCQIELGQITMLDGRKAPPRGLVWTYINDFPPSELGENIPSESFPLVQSYVDMCINGCLEVEARYPTAAGFTRTFLATTGEWSRFWVNDRLCPRRPFTYLPRASAIDAALRAAPETRELYYQVEIEPASWEQRTPVRPGGPAEPKLALSTLGAWECGG